VTAERSLLEALEAGCHAPVGAYAAVARAGGSGGVVPPGSRARLRMQAAVMSLDGSRMLRAHGDSAAAGAWQLGRDLAAELLRSGASDLISVSEGQANSRNDVQ
jgi:hydroxymethylbilane synthase